MTTAENESMTSQITHVRQVLAVAIQGRRGQVTCVRHGGGRAGTPRTESRYHGCGHHGPIDPASVRPDRTTRVFDGRDHPARDGDRRQKSP